jgi:hypothetical protein
MMICSKAELRRHHMDVVVWLRSDGLKRYEAAFRDNEIGETVLPNLTVTWALVLAAIDDGEKGQIGGSNVVWDDGNAGSHSAVCP